MHSYDPPDYFQSHRIKDKKRKFKKHDTNFNIIGWEASSNLLGEYENADLDITAWVKLRKRQSDDTRIIRSPFQKIFEIPPKCYYVKEHEQDLVNKQITKLSGIGKNSFHKAERCSDDSNEDEEESFSSPHSFENNEVDLRPEDFEPVLSACRRIGTPDHSNERYSPTLNETVGTQRYSRHDYLSSIPRGNDIGSSEKDALQTLKVLHQTLSESLRLDPYASAGTSIRPSLLPRREKTKKVQAFATGGRSNPSGNYLKGEQIWPRYRIASNWLNNRKPVDEEEDAIQNMYSQLGQNIHYSFTKPKSPIHSPHRSAKKVKRTSPVLEPCKPREIEPPSVLQEQANSSSGIFRGTANKNYFQRNSESINRRFHGSSREGLFDKSSNTYDDAELYSQLIDNIGSEYGSTSAAADNLSILKKLSKKKSSASRPRKLGDGIHSIEPSETSKLNSVIPSLHRSFSEAVICRGPPLTPNREVNFKEY